MFKKIVKASVQSIGIALAIFGGMCVLMDVVHKGELQFSNWSMSKYFIATLFIGLGFGIPSLVYGSEKLPVALQVLAHMGTGCAVMVAAAFFAGWIPTENGLGITLVVIVGEIAAAVLIWLCFYWHNLRLAKRMNKKIRGE